MKIAIYPDKTGSESYSEKWAKFLKKRNVEVKWVDLTVADALEQVGDCDGLMWRTIHNPNDKNTLSEDFILFGEERSAKGDYLHITRKARRWSRY